ncbi:unnamed protein product [Cylindrotheca closterium]|uniref:Uncharacterized protein n=1 Tax=Cylindrotheca closterium TaxID=2856 RepID=A0AAD2CRQ9_9STRA|nr:unnamed protein product [Cylindrotheca closterium]
MFTNCNSQHPTETIFIHSIQKTLEQTSIIRESWGEDPGRIWDDESIPQQLHLSRLPSGSLSLEPGQRAKVPFTFFPHYPQVELTGNRDDDTADDTEANDSKTGETPSTAQTFPAASSSIFELDWKDMIGPELLNQIKGKAYDNLVASVNSFKKDTFQPRGNLDWNGSPGGDEYQVRTTLLLKTSRGVQKVPLAASSVRTNPQGIPDTIYFRHDTAAATAASARREYHQACDISSIPRSATPAAHLLFAINFGLTQGNMGDANDDTPQPPQKDCYDLYLSNPDPQQAKRITEIMVSRPDLMSVEFDPRRRFFDLLDASAEPVQHGIPPSPTIRHWRYANQAKVGNGYGGGPMILPPDSTENYVATICTVVHDVGTNFANSNDPVPFLRSSREDDYLSEAPDFGNFAACDHPDKHRSLGFVKLETDERPIYIGLKQMKDDVSLLALSTAAGNPIQGPAPMTESCLLKVEPEELNFHLTTEKNTAIARLHVRNKAPFAIKVVRVATGIRLDRKWKSLLGNNVTETMGLNITARLKYFVDAEVDQAEEIFWDSLAEVRKGETYNNMLEIICNLTSGTIGMPMDTLHTTGSVVIRGTTKLFISPYTNPYRQYLELLKKDMFEDEHFLVEIPFNVTVENGRLHAMIERSTHPYPQIFSLQPWDKSGKMISSLFFPSTRFQAIEDSEAPLPPQKYRGAKEISHDLLLVGSKAVPPGIKRVEVLEEDKLPISSKSSLCNRFNVSITDPFETVASKDANLKQVGFLSLQYKFAKQKGGGKERTRRKDENESRVTTCYLNIITSPVNAGNHQIPLIIFHGQLEVSGQYPRKKEDVGTELKEVTSAIHKANIMSAEELFSRLRNSVVGKAYLEAVETMGFEKGAKGLRKFLLQAYLKSSKLEDLTLKAIVMKIGALGRNDVSRTPFFLTNRNPVPISVTIDSGDLEGMSLVLSKDSASEQHGANDGNNILGPLLLSEAQSENVGDGRFEGHPVEGLRQFLLSNEKARSFAARFANRDAVSFNEAAGEKESLLRALYRCYSSTELHGSQNKNVRHGRTNCTVLDFSSLDGPLMVSADKTLVRHLQTCSKNGVNEPQGKPIISIPPGGTARFEVVVTAPSAEFLNTDITKIMASGLSLSTSLGQVVPILIAFEALQGQLYVSEEGQVEDDPVDAIVKSEIEDEKLTVIEVPLGLYWASHGKNVGEHSMPKIPPAYIESFLHAKSQGNMSLLEHEGTSLLLKSTFSREVRLLEVESCNPLFQFVQSGNSTTHADESIQIGQLYSAVSCSSADDDGNIFPSYFQCALNWLGSRDSLQPSGCGQVSSQSKSRGYEAFVDPSGRGANRVSLAFERVLTLLKDTYVEDHTRNATLQEGELPSASGSMGFKSGRARSDGIVTPSLVSVFAEAWDAWRVAAGSGLDVLSSSLRATIEYEAILGGSGVRKAATQNQSLSLYMHNLAVQSVLNAPTLFRGSRSSNHGEHTPSVMKLPPVLVGEIIATMIPLENPTAVPVKVRLAAPPRLGDPFNKLDQSDKDKIRTRFLQSLVPPYVQNGRLDPNDNTSPHHLWWDGGGAFFMDDGYGNLIRSNHNITLRAGKGALVSLVNPSLHANSAFVVGCGARCGIREHNSKMSRENAGPHVSSPIGAAAASGISLLGKQHLSHSQARTIDEPNVQSGGVPGNAGPTAFAIPFPALDEIVIPPFGKAEVGPILFRPPGKFGALGCETVEQSGASHWGSATEEHCKKKSFETMILLENSLTGLERVVLEGQSLQDRLDFLDPLPSFDEDAFGNIENRNGRSTLVFSGSSKPADPNESDSPQSPTSDIKEVVLQNTGDLEQSIRRIYLADTKDNHESDPCTFGSFRLLNCWDSPQQGFVVNDWDVDNLHAGFKLSPGESKNFFIEHIADCKREEESILLNVEYTHAPARTDSNDGPFRRNRRMRKRESELRTASLGVGYFMPEHAMLSCVPARVDGIRVVRHQQLAFPEKDKTEFQLRTDSSHKRTHGDSHYMTRICDCIVLLIASALLAYSWITMPYELEKVLVMFLPSRIANKRLTPKPNTVDQRWLPAYRSLSRSDSMPSELVSIGYEQMSQGITEQYKYSKMDPPEKMGFVRGRLGTATKNGQSQMLSDTLFPKREIEFSKTGAPLLPLGLNWGTATSRGIITPDEIDTPMNRTHMLLMERQTEQEEYSSSDYDDGAIDSFDSFDGYDDDYEENSEDSPEDSTAEDEPTDDDEVADYDEVAEFSVQETENWEDDQAQQTPGEINFGSDSEEGVVANDVAVGGAVDDLQDFQPVSESVKLKDLMTESEAANSKDLKPEVEAVNSKDLKTESAISSPTQKKIHSENKTTNKPKQQQQQQQPKQQQQRQGKQGNKKSEQKASKTTTKTTSHDAKSKADGKLEAENKSRGKKNARKGEAKESTKFISTPSTGTAKQEGKIAEKKDGNKKAQSASPQTSTKAYAKDRGKSQNQSKKAARGSFERASDGQSASKESQKDKLPKSEKGRKERSSDAEPKDKSSKSEKGRKERSTDTEPKDKITKSEKGRKERTTDTEPKAEKISKRKKKKSKKERQEAATAAAATSDNKGSPLKSREKKAKAVAAVSDENAKEQIAVPLLRPPPGLAPPPGFQADSSAPNQDPSALPSTLGPMLDSVLPSERSGTALSPALAFLQGDGQSDSQSDILYNRRRDLGTSIPILAEATANQPLFISTGAGIGVDGSQQHRRTSLETGFIPAPAPPPPAPIDTSGDNGFDVMDFLGSILNESVSEQERPLESSFRQDPSLLARNSAIYSNPWASEGQSRASAYGIAFEAESEASRQSSILDAAVLDHRRSSSASQSMLTPDSSSGLHNMTDAVVSPEALNLGVDPVTGRANTNMGSSSMILPVSVFPATAAEHRRNSSQEEEELVDSWMLAE